MSATLKTRLEKVLIDHDYKIVSESRPNVGTFQTMLCVCGNRYGFSTSHRAHVAEVLAETVLQIKESTIDQMRQLIRDLTIADACDFDHNGGCQAHSYLSLQPGELCPHQEAKELLTL